MTTVGHRPGIFGAIGRHCVCSCQRFRFEREVRGDDETMPCEVIEVLPRARQLVGQQDKWHYVGGPPDMRRDCGGCKCPGAK